MAEQQAHQCGDHDHDHEHGGGCGIQSFHTRDLIVRKDVMEKAKELADLIYTSEEVTRYRKAEKQIQAHERVQSVMALLKKKQKEVVAFEKTFKNEAMAKKIEQEMEELQDELDGIPVVAQFQQSQSDINYLLQLVIGVVRDTVAEKLEVEGASETEEPADCSN
ncbi:RicAFT regulatory complex protein RicA family protein [Paenibacillus kobensis]|uniref:RicAFT regulatory complex protein RicA family protein n=1 Tax=Paenibacillus kobensis TaxID=59841 RepID=UPI000FD95237|nr:YlbF family regulator [Paenibacillus kobensis]